ncbi:MAG: sigma 54-interacting transcriptional regulator [Acidobacteriaceae bacterium]|nr:sigma 54-interacting transcriptional regulator [Acidobacteriaceae bacterium]
MISTGTNSEERNPGWRRFVIGGSAAMQQVCEIIELVASKRCTILITGESGTGKEVIARAIHAASPRAAMPMVAVNCTALPGTLLEAELFGHTKGAFTGAHSSRIGRFEQAHRSSIFLDEIGDLPLDAQAKLLRVLQEQEFQRVGSSETVRVDCRVIAASNIDFETAIRERRFREDLYYRLNVVPIHLPPLRERREDIPLLLEHFIQRISAAENVPLKRISDEAVETLQAMDWPGNIRQLEHTVQMGFALSGNRQVLETSHFRIQRTIAREPATGPAQPLITVGRSGLDFEEVVGEFERSLLEQALALAGGNKAKAASLLKIKRTTLLAKMKSFEERARRRHYQEAPLSFPRPEGCGTALVCEETHSVRVLVCEALRQEGYRVLEASDSDVALELFECWRSEIVLVVAGTQARDGESGLVWKIRSCNPEIAAVLLSEPGGAGPFRYNSQTRVLTRPFQQHELIATVRELQPAQPALRNVICA